MADKRPTTEELIEAMRAPGLLRDQPAVQALLRERGRDDLILITPPTLSVIEGGRDA